MTDDRMDTLIGNLLRTGVLIAASVIAVGGIWYLLVHGAATADYRHFHEQVHGLRSLLSVTPPQLTILIGLLILIATPVARVIFSLAAFALERDHVFVWITAAVLLILAYSIGAALW
jgi:uncharacterized membrane protein